MRRLLTILLTLAATTLWAQDFFGGAQWIGAISRKDANTPEGRHYNGQALKDSREAWAKAAPLSRRSIVLRRRFKPLRTIKRAELRIVGLGFYELSINGAKIGDSEFSPAWSDYDKTVYFNVYDVTDNLLLEQNEISVLLGNGFYNEQGGRYHKLKVSFGPPTLLFFLYVTYDNDTRERLVSDQQWQWSESAVTYNSIYGGEDYDARMAADDTAAVWHPVVLQDGPKGQLCPQFAEPVKVMERYPVKQTLRRDSILVFDMGQNLAGFPEITVQGRAGQQLKLTPGETLTADRLVNQKQTGRPHYYTYTLRGGEEETWHPRFSYYSFRYLQVEGDVEVLKKVESCFTYNSASSISTFECSNPRINSTHQLIDRAIRSNWQSVWTDCPSREKLG